MMCLIGRRSARLTGYIAGISEVGVGDRVLVTIRQSKTREPGKVMAFLNGAHKDWQIMRHRKRQVASETCINRWRSRRGLLL
jgi:hypothetical protein